MLPVPIDSRQFTNLSCDMVESKIHTLTPKQLMSAFGMFEDNEVKDRLMKATIDAFKTLKLDIRQFDIGQLAEFIGLVVKHSPEDLSTFYKYVEQSSIAGQYGLQFKPLARMFNVFAEQGYLEEDTQLQYATHIATKNQLLGDGIAPDMIVELAWSLVVMQKQQKINNPLIPKVLDALSRFEREAPLTTSELLKLYQINIYIKDMVATYQLADCFLRVIPENVIALAEAEFEK